MATPVRATREAAVPAAPAPVLSKRGFRAFVSRFYLRFHMALLLGGTALAGVLLNRLFLALGVSQPLVRFPLGVLCAYGVFFVLVRLWLAWVAANTPMSRAAPAPRPGGSSDRLGDTAGDAVDLGLDAAELAVDSGSSFDFDFDLEGIALVVVIGVVLAAFGVGAYLLWEGPVILLEAAFEMALASGLVRATRRAERGNWATGVLRATALPFLLTLAVAVGVGVYLDAACPGADTVRAAMRQCLD